MKKRKKTVVRQMPSPWKYIQNKARQLPLFECWINEDWQDLGLNIIIVSRKHSNGNITFGSYLVDVLCLGLKDTYYRFNEPESEFRELLTELEELNDLIECDYTLVHNMIYGAIAFASEYGFSPHREFRITQYLLEEYDDQVELLDLEFGENGQPVFIVDPLTSKQDVAKAIAQLERTAGPGNYKVVYADIDDEEDEYDDWDDDDWDDDDWDDIDSLEADFRAIIDEAYEKKFGKEASPAGTVKLKLLEYKISYDAIEALPFETKKQKEEWGRLYAMITSGKADRAIPRLKELIKAYPDNPVYLNYLTMAYGNLGKEKEASETVMESYRRYPQYLFARINYAHYLLNTSQIDKIAEVFDDTYDLKMLYPDRDTFHVSELRGFCGVMCRFFTAKDDISTASAYHQLLLSFNDVWDNPAMLADKEFYLKKAKKVFGDDFINDIINFRP